jgi:hypothetical protein
VSDQSLHPPDDLDATAFYRAVIVTLTASGIPFLVGGTYAFERYAGYSRDTKDLDLFITRDDWPRVAAVLAEAGIATELVFTHWLGKAMGNGRFVDLIFAGGNGLAPVDEIWFAHAVTGCAFGEPVQLCPPEEMIRSKSFVMERERFDGADVMHMLRKMAHELDWRFLIDRFGEHWRVLLAQLVLFGFVYPDEHRLVPGWVVAELTGRLTARSEASDNGHPPVCQGTLLSREQYLVDVEQWGYRDARIWPLGTLSPEEAARWTAAIDSR